LGLYHGCDWFNRVDKDAFFKNYKKVIENRIPNCTIKIASLKEDPDVILGYVCYRGDTLDWVFVKKAWRKMGIAKMLMPNNIKVCTHLTKVGRSIKPKDWAFNPFI
jgi:GNAT superfamily N-acetyltransferase